MARQSGIIKLKGTIGDITFYKSKDGYLTRQKGALIRSVFITIRNFNEQERTRRNLHELVKRARHCVQQSDRC